MKDDRKYDIFISYRREGGEDFAKHLHDILAGRGYSVFFDTDTLRSGDFNVELFDRIGECTDFIIVLSPNALDRCVNEKDWVRQELACALREGKNIVPIRSAKFHFPEELPEDIDAIRKQNGVSINNELFDAMIDRVISFLHSKPKRQKRKFGVAVIAGILAALAIAAFALIPRLNRKSDATNVPETSAAGTVQQTESEAVLQAEAAPESPAASATEVAEPVAEGSADGGDVEGSAADAADLDNYIYKTSSQSVTLQKYFGADETVVTVPAIVEGLPVTAIDEKCFEGHGEIEQIILPDTVSTIGYRAFYGCTKLAEINFPSAIKKIGGWAFAHCGLTEVSLPESVNSLDYGAFYSNLNLTTAVLPVGVASLGENTFRGCVRLKSVTISAPDPEIDINAFDQNSGVTLIGIPGSYTEKYCRATGLTFEEYQGR